MIFRADSPIVATLPEVIPSRIAERFGFGAPLIVRSAAQVGHAVRLNPFIAERAAVETLHVLFLADLPDPRAVASLAADRSPPDTFIVRGQEIYPRMPNGMTRTQS